jgi:hypothetical protein
MRDLLQKQQQIGGVIRGGPRAPRGPMSGIQLANRNRMQRQMQAAARANMAQGGRRSLFGARGRQGPSRFQQDRNFAVPQRPIPNRDGRMASMQNDLRTAQARAQGGGKGQGIKAPRPQSPMNKVNPQNQMNLRMAQARAQMPQSNYMRQPMPPQQIQRGMGRGPMQRGNTGSAQAPRPLFNQQMRQPQARQPLPRRRAQPVRQQQPQARKPLARRRFIPRRT